MNAARVHRRRRDAEAAQRARARHAHRRHPDVRAVEGLRGDQCATARIEMRSPGDNPIRRVQDQLGVRQSGGRADRDSLTGKRRVNIHFLAQVESRAAADVALRTVGLLATPHVLLYKLTDDALAEVSALLRRSSPPPPPNSLF